ncbi:MAG: glycosyltransferase family 4 protein [Vicinamibacterales bacterium]
MKVTQISYNCDSDLRDPDALLARYETMVGWAEALTGAGARVTVVQRFPGEAVRTHRGVTYRFVPSPNADACRLATPSDVVHVHGMIFGRQTWMLRRGLPEVSAMVLQNHGSLPPQHRGWLGIRGVAQRTMLGAGDAFLFAALEQGDAWRQAGLVRAEQSIYGVVSASSAFVPVARDQARAVLGIEGEPAMLWVGRLNANKDPMTVLEGFERVLPDLPRASLTMIYGDAELRPHLERRLAASAALGARVRLVGPVPHQQLPLFYSAADLFVVGSHYEGSGFSLIEALACGLTPVVTRIPSFRAITGESVGALWTPGDADDCARALRAVHGRAQADDRRRVRAHFERSLSWAAIGQRAVEVYRDVSARRRARIRVLH